MRKEDLEQVMSNVCFPVHYVEHRNIIFDKNMRVIYELGRGSYFRQAHLFGAFLVEALNTYAKIYEAGKDGGELVVRMFDSLNGVIFPTEPTELTKSKF